MSPRVLILALCVAILAIGAFIASFVLNVRDGGVGDPWQAGTLDRNRGPRLRVEVLNGAGRAGLAREAVEQLRERGFDVVYFGNASEFDHDSSVVIDRVGKEGAARSVARALGISAVRSEVDSTLVLEVTVILGKDWRATGSR